jgi:ankyrin repeat protein
VTARAKKPKHQPSPRNPRREAALYEACRKGQLKKVEKLLAEGADPLHGHPSFLPPLVGAAFGRNPEIVTLLLEHGAPLADYGAAAVAYAAGWTDEGGEAVFQLLLARGALTTVSGGWGATGLTPVAIALRGYVGALAGTRNAKQARDELAFITRSLERLLDAGADPDLRSDGLRPIEQLHHDHHAYRDLPLAGPAHKLLVKLLTAHGAKPVGKELR